MDIIALLVGFPLAGVLAVAFVVLLAGLGVLVWQEQANRAAIRKRLVIRPPRSELRKSAPSRNSNISDAFMAQAARFLKQSDPRDTKVLHARLIQAGYFDKRAVGVFLLMRVLLLGVGVCLPALISIVLPGSLTGNWLMISVFSGGVLGYKFPDIVVGRRIKALADEARRAFPDFLDLLSVCANAGLSLEAGLERVARELAAVYPSLSLNLSITCAEMRAGKPFEESLKSLADRVPIADIRPFASLLQQSKELGTSLSDALRVYSEDMRHKRLSAAEEKAYALPAKLSVPVTACILPVVLIIAILPVIIRYMVGFD